MNSDRLVYSFGVSFDISQGEHNQYEQARMDNLSLLQKQDLHAGIVQFREPYQLSSKQSISMSRIIQKSEVIGKLEV